MARLLSVNVGLPRDIEWQGKTVRTAVWKTPVQGRRMTRRLNVDGDGQGDLAGHGGEHRALFAIGSEMPSLKLTQHQGGRITMEDHHIRAALDRHWVASDANDFEDEHQIYREDAVLEYPQSGERIRGRRNIQSSRTAQPNQKRFTVRRIIGTGDLWVTEFVLTYDGRPSYTVSIMEFLDGKVARETQYFGDPFEPGPSRAQWVERLT